MRDITCKLLVIGAGPGGYVAAIRAGQLGLDTVIVEAGPLGGTCLNVGCIPSKALIHAANAFHEMRRAADGASPLGIRLASAEIDLAQTVAWKDGLVARLDLGVSGLLKKAGVKTLQGWASFRDGKTVEVETETGLQVIRAESILVATGARAAALAALPFGGAVISSTEALVLAQVPESLAVIGGGYIGLELGTAFAKLGARVTVVEALPRLLPHHEADLVRPVAARLAELGVEVLTGAEALGLAADGGGLEVRAGGAARSIEAEKVLVTIGRLPAVDGFGLEGLDLDRDAHFIRIDARCRTSMRGVHAIGDVTGEPMLAHRAMAQGEMVAEILAGARRSWDRIAVPAICFTDPEIVTAGLTRAAAAGAGIEAIAHQFPFRANGRALTTAREEGFVRLVARADNHLLLGAQAVGAEVSELSAAFTLALEMGARLEDVAATIHAHPSRSEALHEAALLGLGRGLRI